MPTNSTDTDLFPTNVQRPNNGELADAGSLSQGFDPITQRSRWLYNRATRSIFDVRQYGAPGGTGVNNGTFIQNAINAAFAAGGGDVLFPAGSYRIDAALTLPTTVNLLGMPNGSLLLLNHATADFITLDAGTNNGNRCVVSGLGFEALVSNNGKVFADGGSDRSLIVDNCSFNDDSQLLVGRLGYFTGASSWAGFYRSRIRVAGTLSEAIRSDGATARLEVHDSILSMPDTFPDAMITAAAGELFMRGVKFDNSLHNTGAATCVYLSSSATAHVDGCTFPNGPGAGVISGIYQNTGSVVLASDNLFGSLVVPYSTAVLGFGSRVGLRPLLTLSTAAASFTVPNFASTVMVTKTGGSDVGVTFPAAIFEGQPLRFGLKNTTGSPFLFSIAGTVVKEATASIADGQTAMGDFVAIPDGAGGLIWVQTAKWVYGS